MSSSRESSKRKKEANEIPEWIGDATSAVPESHPPLHKRRRAGGDPWRRRSHAPASPLLSPHRGKEQSSRSSLLHGSSMSSEVAGISGFGLPPGRVGAPPSRPLSALWTGGPVRSSTTDSS